MNNVELYHYTDRAGYDALTSQAQPWLPSLGFSRTVVRRRILPREGHEDSLFEDAAAILRDPERLAALPQVKDTLTIESATAIAAVVGSGTYHDIHYGPGWYVTDLTPYSTTEKLVTTLWQGSKVAPVEKTTFWIRISCNANRLRTPDAERPHVMFLPILEHRRLTGDPLSISVQNTSSVYLVAGGTRFGHYADVATVSQMFMPSSPQCLIEPFIFAVSGYSLLSSEMQANLRRYFALEDT